MIAGIVALYLGIAVPALGFYDERAAQLSTERLLAARLRAVGHELPELRAQVASLRQSGGAKKMVFDGASDALAAATLQSEVEELAAASGVAIASSEGTPVEARGDYRRIGLRMAVTGSYDSILALLGAMETATPPLVLDSLQIHGSAHIATMRAATQLDAAYIVYGFRAGGAASGANQ